MTTRRSTVLALAARNAVLGLALVAPLHFATPAVAQPAEQQAEIPAELLTNVENYWHYGKIGRYELQSRFGQAIIDSGAEPIAVLRAFEKVVAEREASGDKIEEWIIRWRTLEATREQATAIDRILMEGRLFRRADPAYINFNINRLAINEVGYQLGLTELRNSGELAVPFLLDTLRDPAKQNLHAPAGRALRDLGRLALNPLAAATDATDYGLLTTVVLVLGDLGYDAAAPYIAAVAARDGIPQAVRDACAQALNQLGKANANAGRLFYELAVNYYYDRAAITADPRYPEANVWFWESAGLNRKAVPPVIFNEIMAMRAARSALSLNAEQRAAQSLWLAANYKREIELPEGATDATEPADAPTAHFYGVASGADYLNAALARALDDRNSALALRVISSMQEIGGESNLGLSNVNDPLIRALQYSDRRVRFEAAFALAGALPQKSFAGQEAVIPLLAEAISQTGQPTVLLVMPTQELVNQFSEALKGEGFVVAGASTAPTALAAATSLPAVDVIVVSEELPAGEIEQLFNLAGGTPKLSGSARLVLTRTGASVWEQRKVSDPLLSTAIVPSPSDLAAPIKAARDQGGALPLDPELATEYATRAGELLKKVAISRGQIFNIDVARNPLLASLEDARPAIAMLAGEVLGLIGAAEAQAGLLAKAAEADTSDELKVSFLKSLATNARFFGNLLSAEQVTTLEGIVAGDAGNDVKAAAAEARGALNLPPDQAKQLILASPAK